MSKATFRVTGIPTMQGMSRIGTVEFYVSDRIPPEVGSYIYSSEIGTDVYIIRVDFV